MQKILFLLFFPALCGAQERDFVRIDTLADGTLGRYRTIEIFEPLPDTMTLQREIDRNRAQIDTLRERNKRLEKQKRDWVRITNRRRKNNAPPRNGRDVEAPAAVEPPKQAPAKPSKKGKG